MIHSGLDAHERARGQAVEVGTLVARSGCLEEAVEVGSLVARSVVEPVVGRNKVGPADSPSPTVIEPSVGRAGDVDVSDPCWQLFCLEHGIDPALAAWSFADRPEMLHAEGPRARR